MRSHLVSQLPTVHFLLRPFLFEFLGCKTSDFTSKGRGVAAAGSGRACPTEASKRPFSAIHTVPELSNSACAFQGHYMVLTVLLEPRATWVTTVALCAWCHCTTWINQDVAKLSLRCTPLPILQCSRPVPTSPCCQRQMLGIP